MTPFARVVAVSESVAAASARNAKIALLADLFRALATIADLDVKRKSGGVPVEVGLETFLLSQLK